MRGDTVAAMGVFGTRCAVSGVALSGDARAILLASIDGGWKPLAIAIAGRYDEYGALEDLDEDDEVAMATVSGLQLAIELEVEPEDMSFGAFLKAMHEADGHTTDHDIRFALVDGFVYEATVAGASSSASLEELFDGVLASGSLARTIYEGLSSTGKSVLRERLVKLTKLGAIRPFDLESSSQYDEDEVRAFADEAKQKHPQLTAAIDANLAEWTRIWQLDRN